MTGRWKLGVAVLVGAAIAVPATVIARGDVNASGPADNFLTDSVANVSTNSKDWKVLNVGVPTTPGPISLTVSAQMTKGTAKFRLAGGVSGNPTGAPDSVLFSSKASNSFTFGDVDSCPHDVVQWKRIGDAKAEAAQVSTVAVYESGICL